MRHKHPSSTRRAGRRRTERSPVWAKRGLVSVISTARRSAITPGSSALGRVLVSAEEDERQATAPAISARRLA